MICNPCSHANHEQCNNYYNDRRDKREEPTKTWCDCQHLEGIYLDQQSCNHYKYDANDGGMEFCPSCGKDMRLAEIDEPDTPAGIDPTRGDSTTTIEGAKVTVLKTEECPHCNYGAEHEHCSTLEQQGIVPKRGEETPSS